MIVTSKARNDFIIKLTILAVVAITGFVTPAFSDPSIGFGLNFSFGGNGVVTSLGVRGFTDNEEDKVAGSLGLDYVFGENRVRPTVGVAYLGNENYIGLDLGFGSGQVEFGLGAGMVDTADELMIQPLMIREIDLL